MARRVGRYQIHDPIASGGMAVVHLGRVVGPAGFSRTVAVKRLHPHLATDPDFVAMFLDEARLASRIQHPNVAATIDVAASEGELFLVMDYVLGASLAQLLRSAAGKRDAVPPAVASSVVTGVLYGLHAAHEARDERGQALAIVHRDVSPQNVLVGADGVARVVDFGVAKAVSRAQSTRDDQVKGKLAYMAPEQIARKAVDRRADVYAAGVVLWETLAGRRLFVADDVAALALLVLEGSVPALASVRDDVPPALDAVLARALARSPDDRFATALDFAAALEAAVPPAPPREVGAWVARVAGADLEERRRRVLAVEQAPVGEEGRDDALDGLLARPASAEEAKALAAAVTEKLSLPSEPEPVAAPRRKVWPWVGVAVAGLLAAAGEAVRMSDGPRVVVQVAADPAAGRVPDAPVPVPPPPDPPAAPEAAAAPDPPPSVAPSATHRPAHPHPPRPHPAASSAAGASCDPAFTIDTAGVKRFKPWCL